MSGVAAICRGFCSCSYYAGGVMVLPHRYTTTRGCLVSLLVLCIAAAVSWVAYASGGSVYVISTNRVNNQTASWFRFEPAASASSSWVTTWQEIAKNSDGTASTTVENGYTSWWNGYGWATPFQHTIGLNHLPTQDLFLTTNPTGDHVLVGLDTNMEV